MATDDKEKNKEKETGFSLSTSSAEFQAKTNDIFGCLSALEDKHIAHEKTRSPCDDVKLWKSDPPVDDYKIVDAKGGSQKRRVETDRDESGQDVQNFKRPRLGPGRPRSRRPDHEVHPERWKEYSLADVMPDDMSEKSNTRTALAFLEDRKKLREEESDTDSVPVNIDESACSKGAITFTKKNKADSSGGVKSHREETQAKLPPSFEDAEENDAVASGTVESSVTENEAKSVSFKSRKRNKQSIRSRNLNDDDGDAE